MESYHDIYIGWDTKFVKATHEDYCSGDECDEKESKGIVYLKYNISELNFNFIKSMRFPHILIQKLILTQPWEIIPLYCPGSGYCTASENYNLKHELLLLFWKHIPITLRYDKPTDQYYEDIDPDGNYTDKITSIEGDSADLEANLDPLRKNINKIVTVMLCLKSLGFPKDMCKYIAKLL